jgi:putative phage-type endonuclease
VAITKEQREARRRVIGASDVGAICGANRWATARDIWTRKVYQTHDTSSKAAERGTMLEDSILRWCEENNPQVVPEGMVMSDNILFSRTTPGGTPIAANTDAVVWSGNPEMVLQWEEQEKPVPRVIAEVPVAVVEAKTSRLIEEWGSSHTDEIPETYILQVQTQMWTSGSTVAWVPALLGDLDFRIYKVEYSPEIMNIVLPALDNFWRCVQNKTPPQGPPPSLSTLRSISRDEEVVTELGQDEEAIVRQWLEAKEAKKIATKAEADLKSELVAALGVSEVGVGKSGVLMYTKDSRGARTLRWTEDK